MKNPIVAAGFALILTASAFAGPISSNGPNGKELLHCTGQIQLSSGEFAKIEVGVAPRFQLGLVAKVSFSEAVQPRIQRTVTINENDPRGLVYSDDSLEILVPNTQPRDLPPGEYRAILTLDKNSSVLNCKNF